jgi:HPt (histidine-containing phosphotransfer) domain-containing protein
MEPEKSNPDLSFLKKFTEGDKDKMKFYIELYLKTAPRLFRGMEDAFDSMNYDDLYSKAHSLKPQAFYVGLVGLSECLGEIETAAKEYRERDILKELVKKANDYNKRGTAELEAYLESAKVL